MIQRVFDILAPHYCYSCGEVGSVLCHSCSYDIDIERSVVCVRCRAPISTGRCRDCPRTFAGMYMVGPRDGALKLLVDSAKFHSVREAADAQARLLAIALPRLESVMVVPVPTIHSHVRRRGYDHTVRMAQVLAKHIDGRYWSGLARRGTSVQQGASREERFRQAAAAFVPCLPVEADTPYLLVDDVTTTGASLLAAARVLRKAGARRIYAAVTTYQVGD